MKKIFLTLGLLSVLLVTAITMTSCGLVSNQIINEAFDPLEYAENNDGSYTVVGFDSETKITDLTIQSEHNGKPVTSISERAFYNCNSLTSITIPDRATLPNLHPQNNYCTL